MILNSLWGSSPGVADSFRLSRLAETVERLPLEDDSDTLGLVGLLL